MKKLIFIIFITILSCKSNFQQDNYFGTFSNYGKDFKYNLELKKEGIFNLEMTDLSSTKRCKGNWKFISNDSIQLTCSEESTTSMLSSAYMVNRVQKIKVLSKRKVKLNNVILKQGNVPN